MRDADQSLPLEGLRVLEFGHTVMGPTCGLILADMGAEVFKVEKAGKGDDTRHLKGFGAGFFPFFNRNKKSISVDLKSEQGKDVVSKLINRSDVLIENFGPGTMDRLGFGYEVCKSINDRLIFCSLKGFMPGPYEKRPALDEVVQMMSGLAYMTGPTGRPLRAGASVVDIMGGTYGAVGILSALHERQRTGKGKFVQATLYESAAFLVGQHMAIAAATGQPPPPMPERGRTWSIYDLFTTADDEQVFLGVTSERHWASLCSVFGFDDFLEDSRLATNHDRIEQRQWFLPELQQRIRKLSKEEFMALAEQASVPFAPIGQPKDLFEDEHLNLSHGLAETTFPSGSRAKLPKIPLSMDHQRFDLRSDPPRVGQGAEQFLLQAGLTAEQFRQLQEEGIITIEQ